MTLARETVLGALAILIAGLYLAGAASIQQSLLADAVGADGVPRMIGYGMAGVGVALIARGVFRPAKLKEDALPVQAHLRALGLLALLIAYLVAVPWLGYGLAIAALLGATALYAGARPGVTVLCASVAGAILFWLMFKLLLGIQMPAGVLMWG